MNTVGSWVIAQSDDHSMTHIIIFIVVLTFTVRYCVSS